MHPLSIFPQLFFLELVAPLLLRLSVGILIIYLGKDRNKKTYSWTSSIYFLSGLLLILGLYTQIAVIVAILLIIFDFYIDSKTTPFSLEKKVLYVMVGIILVSLLFTGPGFLAFDLPL